MEEIAVSKFKATCPLRSGAGAQDQGADPGHAIRHTHRAGDPFLRAETAGGG